MYISLYYFMCLKVNKLEKMLSKNEEHFESAMSPSEFRSSEDCHLGTFYMYFFTSNMEGLEIKN